MHELSIGMSLVEGACEQAALLHGVRVAAVHVRIGPLSGVVARALEFSFEVASADTPIAGARLIIEETPLVVYCPQCTENRVIATPQHLRCPVCGTSTPEIVGGQELELFALEVESDVATHR
ncbi:MAG: hydrogenase maturation nickel metallochaperone HypA [Gemmatimonadota bacterium]|nr:hydrogenase maturation nickel metallochaperone HypA [Gemmatimonadota bacterium]